MKKIIFSFCLLSFFFLSALPVWATVRCEAQYGGEVCVRLGNLQIGKTVWDPENQRFVDNLDVMDHKFLPSEEVAFQLQIRNVGDASLEKVTVRDTLPSFLELVSGNLSFEINNLAAGEVKTVDIKTRVISESNLPKDKSIICDVNVAEARAGELHDRDTAKVCVTQKALKIVALPPTGGEDFPLLAFFLALTALSGTTLCLWSKLRKTV